MTRSASKKVSHSKQVEGDKSVNDPGQLKMMSFLEGSKQTVIVTEQVEEKETLVSDKHDDNSECSEDDVKEKNVGNLSAACSNDNVPFLDEGQRQEQNEKLNFYLHIKVSGLSNNYKVAKGIYISPVPVLKFSLQDFVIIRPFFCAVKHRMRMACARTVLHLSNLHSWWIQNVL